jgi:GH25 family lysozyme M1 (1,4-beta-N-acetylmuramidase)
MLRPPTARRPLRTALLALLGVAGLLVSVPTAASATAPSATPTAKTKNHVTHPQLDWMGSTVRAHEGGSKVAIVPHSVQTLTPGMDVSSYQGDVDWATAWNNGARFAYIKATESTTYMNPYFTQQYNGSYDIGMIRGAYHFATPDTSSGGTQAAYFATHGGGWSGDGKTLPGALDIEYNPYGATCYGLSQAAMVNWIADFVNTYRAYTGRDAVIYSTTDWWTTCTGNSAAFGSSDPLWIARYAAGPGTLPGGWGFWTFWQYADGGTFPGDQDYFNGAYDRLQALANG